MEKITCPEGTYGLAVEPWAPGEVWAVAADWAQSAAPVFAYSDDGWFRTGRQVADYCHQPAVALHEAIADAIEASGDEPDDDAVWTIVAAAEEVE